jgi:hypothetical protein
MQSTATTKAWSTLFCSDKHHEENIHTTHQHIHRVANVCDNLSWFMDDWNIHQDDFHIHLKQLTVCKRVGWKLEQSKTRTKACCTFLLNQKHKTNMLNIQKQNVIHIRTWRCMNYSTLVMRITEPSPGRIIRTFHVTSWICEFLGSLI